ncbi:MAG: hypothetical protein LBL86_04760 [Coriobacteriales bacterium]|jgi:hypothetical protein|nr:hypothetical protein [Coriobacteriales bacterium]
MKKKIAVFAIVGVLLFGGISPAFAGNVDLMLLMNPNGTNEETPPNQKVDNEGRWFVTPRTSFDGVASDWHVGEKVYFRAKLSGGAVVSDTIELIRGSYGYNGFPGAYGQTSYQWYWSSTTVGANTWIRMLGHTTNDEFGWLRLAVKWCS